MNYDWTDGIALGSHIVDESFLFRYRTFIVALGASGLAD